MKKLIPIVIIALLIGYIIGFYAGITHAVNIFIEQAVKFVDIDEVLIRQYIHGAGL